MARECVWIVEDDRSIRKVLDRAMSQEDLKTRVFSDAESALDALEEEVPDVILSDLRLPGMDGQRMLRETHRLHPNLPVVIMTAYSDLKSAVTSYQSGAFEYLPKPFDLDQAIATVKRAIDIGRASKTDLEDRPQPASDGSVVGIIGQAPAMQQVFRAIGRLSHSNITVLITGESGTGKELVARALHTYSPKSGGPFVALNMAAIPKELVEAELFGHERGAFTGASQRRVGRFEQAHGGTLFLDEIGDMQSESQTRLLRVLSEGEFHRVGGSDPIRVDLRVIAASHQDLETLVEKGQFREDLFHRLNVIRLRLPRLSERTEDIPELVRHFLSRAAEELDVEAKTLTDVTARYLQTCPWNGNVRQLENVCRWLTVMATGREIHIQDLPPELLVEDSSVREIEWEESLRRWLETQLSKDAGRVLDTATPMFERAVIETALKFTEDRRGQAAQLLGWGRNTLTRKIRELDIRVSEAEEPEDSEAG